MRIYFVSQTLTNVEKDYIPHGVKNVLVSYYFQKKVERFKKFHEEHPDVNIMLDSGAFTANNTGETIDVKEYTDFCLQVEPYVDTIIQLDVVKDPEASKKNLDYMLKAGVPREKLMSVYHSTEPYEYLDYYCKVTDFIGIGIFIAIKAQKRRLSNFYQNIIERIPEGKKIHLLGMNTPDILYLHGERVYSVDSTSMSRSSSDQNRSFPLNGIGVNKKAFDKSRINAHERQVLLEYNVIRTLKAEQNINDYLEIKCQRKK